MFDLAWSEILLVGVIALIVVGPKDLPDLLRTVGQWVRRARSMAAGFQSTFDQMMRDEELAKTKRDLENSMSGTPSLNKIEKPSYAPETPPFDHSTIEDTDPRTENDYAEDAEAGDTEERPVTAESVAAIAGPEPVADPEPAAGDEAPAPKPATGS
ncbi:Sec-independent protein translocase protein TatB [Zavarzinia marina]|uniref:Sec-independent protein translocase protein TatB n=1 Tax=Zavarzinia marina TaxID=2911065 RepID=UPI0022A89230|nr:Sec-independent protein translocase protein TatB [Zavarzinia marina]